MSNKESPPPTTSTNGDLKNEIPRQDVQVPVQDVRPRADGSADMQELSCPSYGDDRSHCEIGRVESPPVAPVDDRKEEITDYTGFTQHVARCERRHWREKQDLIGMQLCVASFKPKGAGSECANGLKVTPESLNPKPEKTLGTALVAALSGVPMLDDLKAHEAVIRASGIILTHECTISKLEARIQELQNIHDTYKQDIIRLTYERDNLKAELRVELSEILEASRERE